MVMHVTFQLTETRLEALSSAHHLHRFISYYIVNTGFIHRRRFMTIKSTNIISLPSFFVFGYNFLVTGLSYCTKSTLCTVKIMITTKSINITLGVILLKPFSLRETISRLRAEVSKLRSYVPIRHYHHHDNLLIMLIIMCPSSS